MEKEAIIQNCINVVNISIGKALKRQSNLDEKALGIEGYSTPEIRHFLNNICSQIDNYLEIGTFRGGTSCSAIYKNDNLNAYIMDNFCENSHLGDIRGQFMSNFAACKGKDQNAVWFDEDSFTFDTSKIDKKIDVYLYDGDHDYAHHKNAITHYADVLNDISVLLVDDWNNSAGTEIQAGTYDGLKEKGFKIHKEWNFQTAYNGAPIWWNGFFMAVIEKPSK
jgi:hypothetical protein